MRSARGQGTVEYLAVVLLVGLLFAGTATAATGPGRAIATEVPRQVIRALCIVRGGDCYRDVAPCEIASRTEAEDRGGRFKFVKVGAHTAVIRADRSDGSIAVTKLWLPNGGIQLVRGGRIRVSFGRRSFSIGSSLTAEILASIGHARTWIVTSAAEAEDLIAALDADKSTAPPDQTVEQGSLTVGLRASSGRGTEVAGSVSAGLGGGWLADRSSGNRTFFFEPGIAARLAVSSRASAEGSDQDRFALTVGPDGRWLDLAMTRNGDFSARADLPGEVLSATRAVGVPTAAGRRWVTETHLDLSEAGNLTATHALLSALADPGRWSGVADAVRALSERIDENGVVDVRTYAVDRRRTGVSTELTGDLGFQFENTTERTHLLAAATRGIDGQWRDRDDCKEIKA
jgi:hypothetical protein